MKKATGMLFIVCLLIIGMFLGVDKAHAATEKVTITCDSLYIRSDASFSAKIVGVAHNGDSFIILEKKNGLYRIGDGKWISANTKYVKVSTVGSVTPPPSTSLTAEKVIDIAKTYMGVKYVWGGGTPSGFDCSGFTQYVFRQVGIDIPRTTLEQVKTGVEVSKNNLKKGDLVFFQGTYRVGVSHVGIYIEGGNFIHASSNDGVTVSNLNSKYYTEHWLMARRIIK